ncbi:MAG: N-acetylmuramoyl-L-alanine amidase, partial [Spirochaetales bacterium]|nr:N-acetylmuramoyl-L-alanine amidase [Spirochaetales bacterium]
MHKKINFILLFLYIIQLVFSESNREYDVSGNLIRIEKDGSEIIFGEGLPYVFADETLIYVDTLITDENDAVFNKINEKKILQNDKVGKEQNNTVIENQSTVRKTEVQKELNTENTQVDTQKHISEVYLHEMKPDKILINAIVIDAGHGGKDAGAFRGTLLEKNITLKVAKKINELLKKKFPDKKIILTRDSDVFLSLDKRSEIANNVSVKYGASIFVSIHVNASKSPKAYGFETWYIVDSYKR